MLFTFTLLYFRQEHMLETVQKILALLTAHEQDGAIQRVLTALLLCGQVHLPVYNERRAIGVAITSCAVQMRCGNSQ
jgi:hypothetical protein